MIKKFRKKPVVIEAVKWTGENSDEIESFVGKELKKQKDWSNDRIVVIIIPTLEGNHIANIGDWIIKGVKGEFYPCKPDIFKVTYEEAEAPTKKQ